MQSHQASVTASDLQPNFHDFRYSVGVLHHVPDTSRLPPRPKQLLTDT